MQNKLLHFIEHYSNPLFIRSLVNNEILYINKKAIELYDIKLETCDFNKIFDTSVIRLEDVIDDVLKENEISIIYNFTSITATGEEFIVDITFGYFNDEKTEIFLEVIPQNDVRMKIALSQIRQSSHAEAILYFDNKLSIINCNDHFHKVFESNEKLRHSHFNNHLVNGFLPEVRTKLVNEILTNLEISPTYSTKMKVFTSTGEERWYLLELERRTLDNSGLDKIIAYMTNIEKQVEIEEELSTLSKYIEALQELTTDILYHIDVKNNQLHHSMTNEIADKLGNPITNYVDVFLKENIIHQDDQENYITYLKEFYAENSTNTNLNKNYSIRAKLVTQEYQLYEIKAKKIFNSNGELTDVICVMINMDK